MTTLHSMLQSYLQYVLFSSSRALLMMQTTVHTAYNNLRDMDFPFLYASFLVSEFTKQRCLARDKKKFTINEFSFMRVSYNRHVLYLISVWVIISSSRVLSIMQINLINQCTNNHHERVRPLTQGPRVVTLYISGSPWSWVHMFHQLFQKLFSD
jgi:hypothetical protein